MVTISEHFFRGVTLQNIPHSDRLRSDSPLSHQGEGWGEGIDPDFFNYSLLIFLNEAVTGYHNQLGPLPITIIMNDSSRSPNFWYGNAILAIALLVLLKLDTFSKYMGFGAMVLWIALVVAGVWLLMNDKNKPPSNPD